MAQTKTKKASTQSRRKPKARATSKARKPPSQANGASLSAKPKAAGEAVEQTAKDVGRTVGRAASKAKVPLMASGAALAGAAGGVALGVHQARRHRGFAGIDSADLAKAARKVGDFGAQAGEIALEVRRAREANGGGHRSPVEVVLQGLTARGSRH
jgi:hypothetical protein